MTNTESEEPGKSLIPIHDGIDTLDLSDAQKYAVAILRESIMALDELVNENQTDIRGLACVEVIVANIKKDLTIVADNAKKFMNPIMPKYTFTIEGVGTYQKTKVGNTETWDDDKAIETWLNIMRPEIVDKETGELSSELLLKKFIEQFGVDWKVTPFKERGINVDEELREKTGGWGSVYRKGGGKL